MTKRSLILGAVLLFSLIFAGASLAQDGKLAFFDMQKFMTKSIKAKEMQKKLSDFRDVKVAALENKKKELMAMGEELQKQGPMLKEEKRNEKIIEIKKREVEYQLLEKEAQNAVQNEEREFMEVMQRDITKIIGKIRAQRNLAFVFNSVAMVSADDSYDITEEIIKAYDADGEAGKPSAKPKPAAGPAGGAPKPKAPDTKK